MDQILIIDNLKNRKDNDAANLNSIISGAFNKVSINRVESNYIDHDNFTSAPPDLVIIDKDQEDGCNICSKIKFNDYTGHLPVIIITEDNQNGCCHLNENQYIADGFVSKPVKSAELITQIRCMLKIKRVEEELMKKDILIKEMHHRVKNNLTLLISMMSIQSMKTDEKGSIEFIDTICNRIKSISEFHEKLYVSDNPSEIDLADYIRDLAGNLCENFRTCCCVELSFDSEKIPVHPKYAVPCGLIVNEIITNSLKHAFPDKYESKCNIDISLKKSAGKINMVITDNGKGIPGDKKINKSNTMGMSLISDLAERQLKGELIVKGGRGTRFELNFGIK